MRRFGIIALAMAGSAAAQEGVPVIVPSQSSVYNQTSVNLPAPQTAYGQDMVRGADGASCQSSVGSGGPYLDVGVIGSEDVYDRGSTAVYGRMIVPLGRRPRRVDCTRLYELEIARMRMELDMMRQSGAMVPVPAMAVTPPGGARVPPAPVAVAGGVAAEPVIEPLPPAAPMPPVPRPKPRAVSGQAEAGPGVLAAARPRRRGLR